MPDIIVEAGNFTGRWARFNGSVRIPVSRRTYLRSSLTVGFQSGTDARVAPPRLRRLFARRGITAHDMLIEEAGGLRLAPEFAQIDMSEKIVQSYWHGIILAKIVAAQHLGIPWLANVDEMRRQGRLAIDDVTNERGDFVGLDQQSNWHAIEAKARSHPVTAAEIGYAKGQAARIVDIDGVRPTTACACVADLSENPIIVHLQDPPTGGNRPKRLRFEDRQFWRFYYGNLAEFISTNRENVRVDGLPNFSFARLRLFDDFDPRGPMELYLGLPTEMLGDPSQGPERTADLSGAGSPYVGSDHVALAGRMADWRSSG